MSAPHCPREFGISQKEAEDRLREAVSFNDLETVYTLLQRGTNVNSKNAVNEWWEFIINFWVETVSFFFFFFFVEVIYWVFELIVVLPRWTLALLVRTGSISDFKLWWSFSRETWFFVGDWEAYKSTNLSHLDVRKLLVMFVCGRIVTSCRSTENRAFDYFILWLERISQFFKRFLWLKVLFATFLMSCLGHYGRSSEDRSIGTMMGSLQFKLFHFCLGIHSPMKKAKESSVCLRMKKWVYCSGS